jgi:branched-chain amino acid transport system substrate-binding protein
MKKLRSSWFPLISILLLLSSPVLAEDVKVGVLYPLTGPAAQAGIDAKIACELAADIVNTGNYKNLNVPLSKTGLSNFKGGKLVLTVADHQGKPDLGLSEAERLISQEKVNAVLGCYHSAVTETASMVAERMKTPFFAPESSSPKLSRRGFKWFFRSSPHDETFSEGMFQCVAELSKKRNIKFQTIAVIYEDTLYGKDSSRIESELAAKAGYKVVADIAYRRGATSLTSEVLKLKAANPDILFPTSYAPDAILLTKTSKELDYNPKMVMAQNSGHTDPTFTEALGKDVDGISSRTEFSLDLAKAKPLVKEVNDLFKARSGRDFSGTSARAFVGMLVLAEAINRAGSTKPEAIQDALKKTNIPADQLITPWRGVKFDETGQNILVDAIVIQYSEAKQHTVWPFNLAAKDLVYPIPRWSERK